MPEWIRKESSAAATSCRQQQPASRQAKDRTGAGHEAHLGVERLADGGHAAVHHVGGAHAVGARPRLQCSEPSKIGIHQAWKRIVGEAPAFDARPHWRNAAAESRPRVRGATCKHRRLPFWPRNSPALPGTRPSGTGTHSGVRLGPETQADSSKPNKQTCCDACLRHGLAAQVLDGLVVQDHALVAHNAVVAVRVVGVEGHVGVDLGREKAKPGSCGLVVGQQGLKGLSTTSVYTWKTIMAREETRVGL